LSSLLVLNLGSIITWLAVLVRRLNAGERSRSRSDRLVLVSLFLSGASLIAVLAAFFFRRRAAAGQARDLPLVHPGGRASTKIRLPEQDAARPEPPPGSAAGENGKAARVYGPPVMEGALPTARPDTPIPQPAARREPKSILLQLGAWRQTVQSRFRVGETGLQQLRSNLPDKRLAYQLLSGPIIGLALAFVAQGIFDASRGVGFLLPLALRADLPTGPWLVLGAVLYIGAGLVWAFSVPGLSAFLSSFSRPASNPETTPASSPAGRVSRWQPLHPYPSLNRLFLGAALVFWAGAVIRYGLGAAAHGEDVLVRWLWGFSLLAFFLSQLPWRNRRTAGRPADFSMVVRSAPAQETSPAFQRRHWAILAGILIAAFWLRFFNLETLPYDLHGDMASYGITGRELLLGVQTNIFTQGWANIPIVGYLPSALSMWVFGNNLFGLNMTAVLGGMLSLIAVYLLIWRLFDRHRLAALTTALVAINVAHIHFSRLAAYMDPLPFSLFSLYFFVDGLRRHKPSSYAFAGVLMGFNLLMYYSGRVTLFITAGLFLYALLIHRDWLKDCLPGLALYAVGVLLVFGPDTIYYTRHWQAFIQRSQEVWLFNPGVMTHLMGKYGVETPVAVLLEQIRRSLLVFHHSVDSSSQFGFPYPMFNSLLAPFIVLGLGAALRAWKHPGAALCLIWLGLTLTLGSVLTMDAPFWPRLVGIVPAAALLAALALDQGCHLLERLVGGYRENILWRAAAIGITVVFLGFVGWQNWNVYVHTMGDYAHSEAQIGRFLYNLPANIAACELVDPDNPLRYSLAVREVRFLAWPRQVVDLSADTPDAGLEACPGPPFVWILSPDMQAQLPAIMQRWPDGILQAHSNPENWPVFTSYLVLGPEAPTAPLPGIYKRQFTSLVILCSVTLLGLAAVVGGKGRPRGGLTRRIEKFLSRPRKPLEIRQRFSRFTTSIAAAAANAQFPPIRLQQPAFLTRSPAALRLTRPSMSRAGFGAVIWVLAAVGIAYLAQCIFDIRVEGGLRLPVFQGLFARMAASLSEEIRLGIAMGLTVAAVVLWAWRTAPSSRPSLSQDPDAARTAVADPPPVGKSQTWLARLRSTPVGWLGAGLACSLLAIGIYLFQDETYLVRFLYAASLLLVLVYAWRLQTPAPRPPLWLESSPPFRWFHIVILSGVLLVAFALRFYKLDSLPLELSTDMASYGLVARSYITGAEQRIFGDGWFYIPRLAFLPYALSMQLAGNNLFGLYFGTVMMGMLHLAATYLLVWRLCDSHRLAALAMLITTLNPAHIQYSRIPAFIDPWVSGSLALFLIVDGLRLRRSFAMALAGVLVGFSLQNYPAGRVLVPILVVFFLYAYAFRRRWITENWGGLVLFIVGGLAAFGPNLVYFTRHWDIYVQRAREVALSDPNVITHLKFTYQTDQFWIVLWEQFRRALFTFQYYTDRSAHFAYPHPMFHPWLSPLLYLGLGTAVVRWRKPGMALVTIVFGLILLTGGVLSVNAPTWSRLVGLIPMAALLIALPIDALWNKAAHAFGNPARVAVAGLLCVLFVVVGIQEWQTYYRDSVNYARPVVRVGRYLNTLPPHIAACGLTNGFRVTWAESQFLAWPRRLVDLDPNLPTIPEGVCPAPPVVWIVTPDQAHWLDELRLQWPQGIEQLHSDADGQAAFSSFLVPAPP
jgi:4-amino-4-deoxy-L-arabinose transferase-like glycosyltransferase